MNKKKLILIIILVLVFVISGGFIFTQRIKSQVIKDNMKLGNKYLEDGKYEEAELALLKVISVEPKNVEARIQLAKAYTAEKKYDKAEQTLKDAIAIESNDSAPKEELAKLYILQGKELLSAGKLNEAKDMFDKAVDVDESRAETYLEISACYEESPNRLSESLRILNTGFEETKDTAIKNKMDEISSKMTGNTPGNIFDGGMVARKGDWIYYQCQLQNSMIFNIFKIKADGSGKTQLNNLNSFDINVVEDRIYYIAKDSSNNYSIYRMDTYGNGNEELVQGIQLKKVLIDVYKKEVTDISSEAELESFIEGSNVSINDLNINDNKMYFNVSFSYPYNRGINMLVSCNTDGLQEKVLCKSNDKVKTENGILSVDPNQFMILGEWIYYHSEVYLNENDTNSCLFRIKRDGTGNSPVYTEADGPPWFSIGASVNNFYYLIRNSNENTKAGLYKVSEDLKEKVRIDIGDVSRIYYFNVFENYIYYLEGNSIYKIKIDGSGKAKINTIDSSLSIIAMNVVDEWIYLEVNENGLSRKTYICRVKMDGTDLQVVN